MRLVDDVADRVRARVRVADLRRARAPLGERDPVLHVGRQEERARARAPEPDAQEGNRGQDDGDESYAAREAPGPAVPRGTADVVSGLPRLPDLHRCWSSRMSTGPQIE